MAFATALYSRRAETLRSFSGNERGKKGGGGGGGGGHFFRRRRKRKETYREKVRRDLRLRLAFSPRETPAPEKCRRIVISQPFDYAESRRAVALHAATYARNRVRVPFSSCFSRCCMINALCRRFSRPSISICQQYYNGNFYVIFTKVYCTFERRYYDLESAILVILSFTLCTQCRRICSTLDSNII